MGFWRPKSVIVLGAAKIRLCAVGSRCSWARADCGDAWVVAVVWCWWDELRLDVFTTAATRQRGFWTAWMLCSARKRGGEKMRRRVGWTKSRAGA